MPLAKTQPQFGNGRIVNEKITFEMPSTMKNTADGLNDSGGWVAQQVFELGEVARATPTTARQPGRSPALRRERALLLRNQSM
jgi:hypothetical protein